MHEGSRHQSMIDRGLSKRFLDRLDATLLHPGGMSREREPTNFGGLRDLKEVKVLNPEGSYLRIESIVLELALGHPWGRTSKASPGLQRPLIESVVAEERQVNLT